jgi:hypothetical protein
MTRGVERDLLTLGLATSAGIHAGLVPVHLEEEPGLGVSFVVATTALWATIVALRLWPSSRVPAVAALVLLAGLLAAYAVSRLSEPIDALGLATKAAEAAALVLAWRLGRALEAPAHQPRGAHP